MAEQCERRLMNFLVPLSVGSSFSKLCKLNSTSMTTEVIRMMENYIEVMVPEIARKSEVHKTVDQTFSNRVYGTKNLSGKDHSLKGLTPSDSFRGAVKHPTTGEWMSESEWRARS